MKKILSKKWKIVCGVIVIIAVCVSVLLFMYPPDSKEVYDEFIRLSKTNSEIAADYLLSTYDGKGIFGKIEDEKMGEVRVLIDKETERLAKLYQRQLNEERSKVELTSVDFETSASGNYVDVLTTIKNNSSLNIKYVKINIYYKDDSGNIVRSEWANDNSIIKSGASQVVRKMTEVGGWTNVTCEIAEINFE